MPNKKNNSSGATNNAVAVIIPVYRDTQITKKCMESAMAGTLSTPGARLIVINDASPDTEMHPMLNEMAKRWPETIELLTNDVNLGFVATVNRGIHYCPGSDVVLLNSDVVLPHDWLSRLADEAYSQPKVASVTPLSNNTTICTFPEFLQDNKIPFGLDVNAVDAVFRAPRLGNIEAPTGIGFCMYIRRVCLDEVGSFDLANFKRGYGEENDFCQRAIKAGWVNLITPNMYVYHQGGVSFGEEKDTLVKNAMLSLDRLHPNYHADIQAFVSADPLKLSRLVRYAALLAVSPVPIVLHVSHGLGGGVEQHIEELMEHIDSRAASLLLAPGMKANTTLRVGVKKSADSFHVKLPEQYSLLVQFLKRINVAAVHYHHILNVDDKLLNLPGDLGVSYQITIHDFYLLTANPTLTNEQHIYPGEVDDGLTNPAYPMPEKMNAQNWREKHRVFVEGAKTVIFPSISTERLFDSYYTIKNPVIVYHLEDNRQVSTIPDAFRKRVKYKVAVIGAISREKGADFLQEIASHVKQDRLPFEFVIIGYAYRPLRGISSTGPYQAGELANLLYNSHADFLFFPARWPETYSYTLSYALQSKLPIIAPNIGAFPERLAGREQVMLYSHLLPASGFIDRLCDFVKLLEAGERPVAPDFDNDRINHRFYDTEYAGALPEGGSGDVIDLGDLLENFQLNANSKSTLKELVLRRLWKLYTHPSLRWLSSLIPFPVRRFIKRSLSKHPIHDVV